MVGLIDFVLVDSTHFHRVARALTMFAHYTPEARYVTFGRRVSIGPEAEYAANLYRPFFLFMVSVPAWEASPLHTKFFMFWPFFC